MSLPDYTLWPAAVLKPAQIQANPVPFSRSGGVTLGGVQRSVRTDRGYWSITYRGVPLGSVGRRRCWNAVRTLAGGMADLLAVPVWSFETNPWAADVVNGRALVPHSDGATFSDGSRYAQRSIVVEMAAAASVGATSVTLRLVHGIDELAGVRFSYEHALYETGLPTAIVSGPGGDEWTLPVFPAIRVAIPDEAGLELDLPTCLVRLASDRAMDTGLSRGEHDRVDVAFVEATDVWADLAA